MGRGRTTNDAHRTTSPLPKAKKRSTSRNPLSFREVLFKQAGASSDFRRVATRYDRNAANFLAAVCIAATVAISYE